MGYRWQLFGLVTVLMLVASQVVTSVRARRPFRGEFDGDMELLKRCHVAPGPGESNHYIDLWDGRTLALFSHLNGLTNNRALFIDSHGERRWKQTRSRFVYRPHRIVSDFSEEQSIFSARDLATVLGPAATNIHNIVVGACNEEGAFDSRELRHHFPQATNITHMVAGQPGFKEMFFQSMIQPSVENRPSFAVPEKSSDRRRLYRLSDGPSAGAVRINPYQAELFLPEAVEPYKVRTAGREILEPSRARIPGEPLAGNRAANR